MQYCNCTVAMHDGRFKVRKYNVSVPEVLLLRHLWGGDDRVTEIEITGFKKLQSNMLEKQRLVAIYGGKAKQDKLLEALFPGVSPRFPTSFREIATEIELLNAKDPQGIGAKSDAQEVGEARAEGDVQGQGARRISVPAPVEGEIRVEGEDDAAPVPLAEQEPEDTDYRFLNEKPAAEAVG